MRVLTGTTWLAESASMASRTLSPGCEMPAAVPDTWTSTGPSRPTTSLPVSAVSSPIAIRVIIRRHEARGPDLPGRRSGPLLARLHHLVSERQQHGLDLCVGLDGGTPALAS